jgi:uncharacterized protein (DUF2236 family)
MQNLKQKIVADIEAAGGRHDEPEIYGGPAGDPGIGGGPGSISWEINGDLASLVVGGTAAILMEVLHPSVMAGVFTQSSYRTEPERRARNTLGYVLRTTFGSTRAATEVIDRVKKIHGMVGGTRADGVAYRALDPELIAWVHTCIPWAVMRAFETYHRPLSIAEKDHYLAEQAVIGRMGGADWVPESVSELEDYVEKMRPLMAMNDQTVEFIGFAPRRRSATGSTRSARPLDRPPRLDGPHARMGTADDRHLRARSGVSSPARPEQLVEGQAGALGVSRAALQANGSRTRDGGRRLDLGGSGLSSRAAGDADRRRRIRC